MSNSQSGAASVFVKIWLVLALLHVGASQLAAQDTIRFGQCKMVETIHADGTKTMRLWHATGEPVGTMKVLKKGREQRPVADYTLKRPDGTKYQYYSHTEKAFYDYDERERLYSKLLFDIDADSISLTTYYTTGKQHSYVGERHNPGENPLTTNSGRNGKAIFFRQVSHQAGFIKKFWYPDGTLLSQHVFDPVATTHTTAYYFEDGTVDDSTYLAIKDHKLMKYGTHKSYSVAGYLESLEQWRANQRHGLSERYSRTTGTLLRQSYYKNDKLHGSHSTWFENGTPQHVSVYLHGKQITGYRYHPNGKVAVQGESNYGIQCVYDTLGQLKSEHLSFSQLGNNSRLYLNYAPKNAGDPIPETKYEGVLKGGLRDGLWKATDKKSGKLYYEGTYNNGMQIGLWTYYGQSSGANPRNNVLYVNYDEAGLVHGEARAEVDGILLRSGTFVHGERNGLWHNYTDTGVPETVHEYTGKASPRLLKAWHPSGALEFELYEKDGLEYHDSYAKEGYMKQRLTQHPDVKRPTKKTFDAKGNMILLIEPMDSADTNLERAYHPNGKLKYRQIRVGRQIDGPYEGYYENGRPRTEGQYIDGHEDGKWTFFDERGKVSEVRVYKDGNEVFEPKPGQECWCNDGTKALKQNSFVSRVRSFIDLKKINDFPHIVQLDTAVFKKAYMRRVYGESMTILTYGDMRAHLANGVSINLTPCRRGRNTSQLDLHWQLSNQLDNFTSRHNSSDFNRTDADYYLLAMDLANRFGIWQEYSGLGLYVEQFKPAELQRFFMLEYAVPFDTNLCHAINAEGLRLLTEQIFKTYEAGEKRQLYHQQKEDDLYGKLYTALLEPKVREKGFAPTLEAFVLERILSRYSQKLGSLQNLKAMTRGHVIATIDAPYIEVEFPSTLFRTANPEVNPQAVFQLKEAQLRYKHEVSERLTVTGQEAVCSPAMFVGKTKVQFTIEQIQFVPGSSADAAVPSGTVKLQGSLLIPCRAGTAMAHTKNLSMDGNTITAMIEVGLEPGDVKDFETTLRQLGFEATKFEGYGRALRYNISTKTGKTK